MNGQSIIFTGKSPKILLTLIKTLVLLGPDPVQETELMDILWPDAEGDKAQWSLKTSLKRARKLMGSIESIIVSNKTISLNYDYCFIDWLELEENILKANKKWESALENDHLIAIDLTQKAISCYVGDFLPGDFFWSYSKKKNDKLKSNIIKAILSASNYYKKKMNLIESIKLLEKGINLDPLSEEIVINLMKAYSSKGKNIKAKKTFLEFKEKLYISLTLQPSKKTIDLFETIN